MASGWPFSTVGTGALDRLAGHPQNQGLGLLQKLLIGLGDRPLLLDEVVQQLRHLLVESRIGQAGRG